MISIEELKEVKEKRKTNLYYEEKEYLQYIFLNSISKYPKKFVFKGGTCLKICFGLERASEDLDFSTSIPLKEVKKIVEQCLKDFEYLNIEHKIYSEKEFKGNIRFEIRFKGPSYTGDKNSTNTLKVDFNKQKSNSTEARVVQKLFSDVPLFTINVLAEKEILAEKIMALINRSEPRDLYDLWILLSKGVEIDINLINIKLKEEKSKLSKIRYPSRQEYEVSLKSLINFLPSYEQVLKETSNGLNNISKRRRKKSK